MIIQSVLVIGSLSSKKNDQFLSHLCCFPNHTEFVCILRHGRYKSPSQAERAISKNGAFLSNHIMIGVQSMNPRRARDMNVSIHSDGRMVHKGSGLGSVSREGLLGTAVR